MQISPGIWAVSKDKYGKHKRNSNENKSDSKMKHKRKFRSLMWRDDHIISVPKLEGGHTHTSQVNSRLFMSKTKNKYRKY